MPTSTIISDNGVLSGTTGLKTAGGDDGTLVLQTTTAGGTATTAMTINTTQQVAFTAGTASAPSITPSGDPNTGIFFPAADTIAFSEGGAEVARFDSNGSLLIATTNAITGITGTQLTASNTNENPAYINIFRDDTTIGNGQFLGYLQFCGRDATSSLGTAHAYVASVAEADHGAGDNATALTFGTTPDNSSTISERMRIAANGYVYINNSTSFGSQDGHISIAATVAGQQCIDSWNSATSGTRFHAKFRDSAAATVRGSITSDGANTAYVTSSDYRLKENISLLTNALSTVVQLKPSTWTWKENQEAGQGFIAHELAEIVPQAVTGEKDAVDANGNPQYQGVDTSFLVATLTAAIQELKAELDTVKTQNAAFEARLAVLEAK